MPINYCNACAGIRSMEISRFQTKCTCDLCGVTALCTTDKISVLKSPDDAFSEAGYFNSNDLSGMLALIKSRQSVLAARIKWLQLELSSTLIVATAADDIQEISELVESGTSKRTIAAYQKLLTKLSGITGRWGFQGTRETKVVVLQNLIAEKSGLAEKEKELSILYKNALDQILIKQLRFRIGAAGFDKCYEESKRIYLQQSKLK